MGAGRGSKTAVVVVVGDREVLLARLDGLRADLALVDTLARLQLVARRFAWSIRLVDPWDGLVEILELAGLSEVLLGAPPGSTLEADGEAEEREQFGIEEVVEPGDAPV